MWVSARMYEEGYMKFAILAPGKIAQSMVMALRGLKDKDVEATQKLAEQLNVDTSKIELYAVASRDIIRAEAFAEQWGFEKAYGSYEEMLADDAVELVYVASPHSYHYEHAKLCLEYGKHVLLEKPFTVNAIQAKELVEISQQKGLLLAEAIWTRYMPSRDMINDIVKTGVIGKVTSITANLGYPMRHKERLCNPALAGGALLDVGVYPIHFALMVVDSKLAQLDGTAVMSPEGVDWTNSVTLTFDSGELAILHSTMLSPTDRLGVIYGEKGYMEVININNCEEIRVFDSVHNMQAVYTVPEQINGYEYEVLYCMKAIQEQKIECEKMPHSETIRVMQILDTIRAKWGMKYPCE